MFATQEEIRLKTQQGLMHLRAGQAADARRTFEQLVQVAPQSADAQLGLAHALRMLKSTDEALVAVDAALNLQPRHIGALALKGDLLDAAGQATAASFYQAVLKCAAQFEPLPREWAAVVDHARVMCQRYARQYEETLRRRLSAMEPNLGSMPRRFAQSVDLLLGNKQVYPSAPLLYLFPELPTVQFYDREQFPWLVTLERATADIRSELLALMSSGEVFSPYLERDGSRPVLNDEALLGSRDWSACFLWKNGVRSAETAARCPVTEATLAELPIVNIPGRSPSVLFSLMRPRTHIPAHHGFVNTRLIVHLPLIVPQGCRFRVGNETREWVEGEAWLFDDTIEHEAWNDSDQTRVVLLFEVWRPELTQAERTYVSTLFESIAQQGDGTGDWGI